MFLVTVVPLYLGVEPSQAHRVQHDPVEKIGEIVWMEWW